MVKRESIHWVFISMRWRLLSAACCEGWMIVMKSIWKKCGGDCVNRGKNELSDPWYCSYLSELGEFGAGGDALTG